MSDYKIIHDTVHGNIKFEGATLRILETPEMQRLNGIKQLGLSYLVFPGANHTRLEHSIGVGHVAGKMGEALNLPDIEVTTLRVAGMLHDLGHSPYSHTLEYVLHEKTGWDHMDITTEIIRGNLDIITDEVEGRERLHEILNDAGVDIDMVCRMIKGEVRKDASMHIDGNQAYFGDPKNYMVNIISGSLDADQMDYLLRDAHYTGVAHGMIDIFRILNTLKIKNGELMVDKKGVPALEGMLVARALMYTSVYFHKTNRIGELMLSRAVEELDMDDWLDIYRFNDAELMSVLKEAGGFPHEVAMRLKYRKLFKKAIVMRFDEIENNHEILELLKRLSDLKYRRRVEEEIAQGAGVDSKYVLIDIPGDIAKLSEPRLNKTDVKIVDGQNIRELVAYSPLARALQIRKVQDWAFMLVTKKEYTESVTKSAKRMLPPY
uniref:Metal-dependent phosphohydrolase n=1 Tax=uncultured euryarchaeote Alv-FOS4 TaxID=337893 RepID=Q3SA72_9EURY|nr:metal-dependent phosphohydrolase [uncultured euryarchaeote Alv-FOS4]